MKTIAVCFLMVVACISSTFGQTFNTIDNSDELFTYKVKTIDEFIERFDDDKNSFLRMQYEREKKTYQINRTKLITTLFNQQNPRWVTDSLPKLFVKEMTNSAHPVHISFTDSNWYAEVNCVFTYEKKDVIIPLILHINTNSEKGSKWVIAGIGNNSVVDVSTPVTLKNYRNETNTKFISTPSHATDFVELHNVFGSNMNPVYYFDNSFICSNKGKHFIDLVLKNKILFQNVKDMNFHFFNAGDWIFTVNYFDREQYNSGWLIEDLAKAGPKEKEIQLKRLLNL